MYGNGKMIPVQTIPGMGEGEIKKMMEGVDSSMMYLIYCMNIYKCHNAPPTQHNNKKMTPPPTHTQKILRPTDLDYLFCLRGKMLFYIFR
jgi:hypothetical protein